MQVLNTDIFTLILDFFPQFLFTHKNKNLSHIPKIISIDLYNFKCVSKFFKNTLELYLKKYKYCLIDFYGLNFVKNYFVSNLLNKYYINKIELYKITNFLIQFYDKDYYSNKIYPNNLQIYQDIICNAIFEKNLNYVVNLIETDNTLKNNDNLLKIMNNLDTIQHICELNNKNFIRYLHKKNILNLSINYYFHFICVYGMIDLLKELYFLKYAITEYYFEIACISNNLEVMSWLYENINITYIEEETKTQLINRQQINVIDFLKNKNLM